MVGKGGFFAGTLVVDGLVADAFGDVVQSDVVPEIEENAGNGYGNAGGEADVQRVEFFFNIPLVEIIKSNLALLVPYVAYFRAAEYGKAVRPFFDDVVAVDYGNPKLWIEEVMDAISGTLFSGASSGSGFSKVMLQRLIV